MFNWDITLAAYIKNTAHLQKFHWEEDPTDIWYHYYGNVSLPPYLSGNNIEVIANDNKCFTYICSFFNIQRPTAYFTFVSDYLILLCESIFCFGKSAIYIESSNKNDIVIDKFCSFEAKNPTSGDFSYFYCPIISKTTQGSVANGGDRSADFGMICQEEGFASLSKTNISNCISQLTPGF